MGVRMEGGGGRSPGSEYPTIAILRYGPASPFKGHLSTKSNAFCIDSSRSLCKQYLIRDHMVVHYNKILSAKAAVDCSVPKSRLASIKFSDQQRREKLRKEIARCKKEMTSAKNSSWSSSRGSGKPLSSTFEQVSCETEDNEQLSPCAQNSQKYLSRSLSFSDRQGLDVSSPTKCDRKDARKTSNASASKSRVSDSSPLRKQSEVLYGFSADSVMSIGHSHTQQEAECKLYSGDLLDKHSDCFTDNHQPFTPRTLKSEAKSFLSEYRYYTPAKRKRKNIRKQRVEAETQTDVSSFQSEPKASERKVTDFQKIITQAEDVNSATDEPEGRMDVFQYSLSRETSLYSEQSSARIKIQAEEEELLYLTFIEEVTDEILKLGLFSNRVLERLFERHIEENRHRLNESKMRHLLDVLKVDLGCSTEEKSEKVNGNMEAFDLEKFKTMDQLQITSKNQGQNKITKSSEFLKAMDLLSKDLNKLMPQSYCETPEEICGQNGFSKDLTEEVSIGTDPYSSVKSESVPDISHSLEPTLNSTTCESDFETNKELDDLEESFAEALQISNDYVEE
ncbi:spermatogenesis-associated protein 7 isoform X1 [Alligator mississippiensis]|uniref:spermatogenesis-associated protein 7 isoform X1 n=1 Tax=Alligator mississippiensis TaxID=8496 RepID=UPI0028778756|nr:spermatogenesis-associated protein 7 isoform X1 [Alligator mississippiensis]